MNASRSVCACHAEAPNREGWACPAEAAKREGGSPAESGDDTRPNASTATAHATDALIVRTCTIDIMV